MEENVTVLCPKCKERIPSFSAFCLYCGAELKPQKQKKPASRRPMNSGTVRKLSGRREKPYAAYLPRSMGGKYIGSYKTKAEASDALVLALANRPSSNRADWTVKQFYEYYISSNAFQALSKQTQASRTSAWKHCQKISSLKMKMAKAHEWQSCVDDHIENGYSKSSCRKIKELASQLCQEAMRDDVISKNYAELLIMGGKSKKNRDIFTVEEIQLLRSYDNDERIKFILILVYTGMRISELLKMPVENVHEKYMIGGSKTEAGKNRIIPILPDIKPYIDYFMIDGKYLIGNSEKPISAGYARKKWFYAPLVEIGILTKEELLPGGTPRLTPHFSRHTFSSLATEAGVDEKAIARIVGHTSYKTTDQHYVELQADYLLGEMMKMSHMSDNA